MFALKIIYVLSVLINLIYLIFGNIKLTRYCKDKYVKINSTDSFLKKTFDCLIFLMLPVVNSIISIAVITGALNQKLYEKVDDLINKEIRSQRLYLVDEFMNLESILNKKLLIFSYSETIRKINFLNKDKFENIFKLVRDFNKLPSSEEKDSLKIELQQRIEKEIMIININLNFTDEIIEILDMNKLISLEDFEKEKIQIEEKKSKENLVNFKTKLN